MSKILKQSSIKLATVRQYAAKAAPASQQVYALPSHQVQVTDVKGATVASLEDNSPLSQIGILFKAGSRYESYGRRGIGHALRTCVGGATNSMTTFYITRKTAQMGGNLFCETGREHILYGIQVLRDNIGDGLSILGESAVSNAFKDWEVDRQVRRMKYEKAMQSPCEKALQALHEAAYRGKGLSNSLYAPDNNIGQFFEEELSEFVTETHTVPRMSVVGLGMDHSDLLKFVDSFNLPTTQGSSGLSPYGGGEVRIDAPSPLAFVAIAGQGASFGSSESAALLVAKHLLFNSSHIAHGSASGCRMSSVVAAAGGSGAVSAINCSYSDSGLFGFFLCEEAGKATKTLEGLNSALKGLKVTDEEVNQAKARAKTAIFMDADSRQHHFHNICEQSLLTKRFISASDATTLVDAVTTAAVKAALGNVFKGKMSMGAYGNLSQVPYLDELQ